ncbi:hypothetical protein JCM24511_00961 [Saitozyma sp. JCM 24511]|nr:hypothetical protein JCM24511_00961 [Saitozyma sp. JCM 24511]
MPQQQANPWSRRLRRLFFFAGTVSTIYLLSSFALERMREARVRALKERKERDLLKSHFSSLLDTISFTLYALLPTLSPQLTSAYPVEETSGLLQGISNPSSSVASIGATPDTTPANSLLLQGEQEVSIREEEPSSASPPGSGTSGISTSVSGPTSAVGESWASEFQNQSQEQSPDQNRNQDLPARESLEGSEAFSLAHAEGDDGVSSVASQPISLPPTDLSSFSGSPTSDLSQSAQLQPSPPRVPPPSTSASLQVPLVRLDTRSKKELWRDLKLQSLTRSLTTAYLLPLLYLLTASQLATLARLRYLHDVEAALPPPPESEPLRRPSSTPVSSGRRRTGWLSSFSIDAMGLTEFVDETTTLVPNPVSLLPNMVTRRLPIWLAPRPAEQTRSDEQERLAEAEAKLAAEEEQKAEAERTYLTYSWWLLHEGWKSVGQRVQHNVERVFGSMPLKRELSIEEWDGLVREVRAGVETSDDGETLYDFAPLIIPPTPLPPCSDPSCPLPAAPTSSHLEDLLSQTRSHLTSPDGRYLINKGVDTLVRRLLETLRDELYFTETELSGSSSSGAQSRRLVDCLPVTNRWGKGIWEGIPDGGVEALLALPEYQSFSALVFGDWAPR